MMLFFRKILIQLNNFYQKILSPDHSFWAKKIFPWGYCKFQPTCSEYSKQALQKYGVMKGGIKTIWRILRCNPWSRGGKDPLSH